jgi:hypothetical protein
MRIVTRRGLEKAIEFAFSLPTGNVHLCAGMGCRRRRRAEYMQIYQKPPIKAKATFGCELKG